ncbi:hypothetical protein [Paenibacillus sp. J22TS3]|uniref:hypothetical protein n=1 Tax=Paenibacillus sp. J22TS3 TaxID=2807192 RepID=UPI001B17659D|nr:hypothetical protein [Paenibacillus sp. J22TS3]GIP20420.1 hypothetical protein J22TS3_06950 [Paenibacillus sp. J22TS3]
MEVVNRLGRRFFWDKVTGNIIAQRNEMEGALVESTKEQDFALYAELAGYSPEAVEMTTFEYGQYAEDFSRSTSWRFDPSTKKIQFYYPDDSNPGEVLEPQQPLTEQVTELRQAIADLTRAIATIRS